MVFFTESTEKKVVYYKQNPVIELSPRMMLNAKAGSITYSTDKEILNSKKNGYKL